MAKPCRNSCSLSSSTSSSLRLAFLLAVTTTYGTLLLSSAATAASSADPSIPLRGGRALMQQRRAAVAAAQAAFAASTAKAMRKSSSAAATTTTTSSDSFTPPTSFPYTQCLRNPASSRLFATANPNVTTLTQNSTNTSLTRICFDVQRSADCAHPGSPCCDFQLYKMELEVDPGCADSLAFTTIDGIQHVRFFQTAPHPSIKIVNLDRLPVATATATATATDARVPESSGDGSDAAPEGMTTRQVCLYLRPACNTLSKLCASHDGTCSLALFSRPGAGAVSCCPLSRVSL